MYDELVKRLRRYTMGCVAYKLDSDFADAVQEAAEAIEHMQKTILRLENELGIYDDLPMVDQREQPKEEHGDV